jgi:hypothetical protein
MLASYNLFDLGQKSATASCEHDKVPSDSIKEGKFVEHLSDRWFLKNAFCSMEIVTRNGICDITCLKTNRCAWKISTVY